MAMIPTDLTIDPALRPQAESLLSKTRKDIQEMEAEDVLKTIHIFQLRLIELTVQNEALRLAQSDAELSRQQYCNFFDFAPVGYLLLDEDSAIIKANIMAASFLGCEGDVLKKQKLSKFISAKFQDAYHLHFRDVFRTGSPGSCELQLANNDVLRIQVSSHTINAPDPVCLTTISDITNIR
ncbi:MAG: hypothetical protein CO093_11260 [Alphaproteobacteria bacterium CG_4_9_14_3_um_filter_47_13]|nr:MAG: hypothetical protein CO093_11260 [Alphaproteobacteria bacterium CG_4_9_14_3_um_filter_47_13]